MKRRITWPQPGGGGTKKTDRAASPQAAAGGEPEEGDPQDSCAICLGRHEDRSLTDNCRHQFCFRCLYEWSKVKQECPLCKRPFAAIVHDLGVSPVPAGNAQREV